MTTDVSISITAPRERVWSLVTDIDQSPRFVSGIERVEVLERPSEGIRGLKWVETRTLFGKTATETMWISEAVAPDYYVTEARSHGSFYRTEVRLSDEGAGTRLSMVFEAKPEATMAKILSLVLGGMIKRSVRKALLQDLRDIKQAAEA